MKRILVSRCLLEEGFRYDGKSVRLKELEELKDYDIIPVCPEVELLGLPSPRPRLKFVPHGGRVLLLKEDTGEELYEKLRECSEEFLRRMGVLHGAVLKSKSPSCGLSEAKIYESLGSEREVGRRRGVFSEVLLSLYPNLPVITDEDFSDPEKRKKFFKKVEEFNPPNSVPPSTGLRPRDNL